MNEEQNAPSENTTPEEIGNIFIGTCSFTEEGMVKTFYPPDLPAVDRISYYAEHMDTVEVDSSFYTLPSERNSLLFVERTPKNFKFHFKAFGMLTRHPVPVSRLGRTLREYLPQDFFQDTIRKPSSKLLEKAFEMFWSALLPIHRAGKLKSVLFQFPPWYAKSEENMKYIVWCREMLPDFLLTIEFRHGSWLSDRERENTFEFLRQHNLCYVSVDEPQTGEYGSIPPLAEVTGEIAYLRFHGRNTENWLKKGITVKERFSYLYSESELKEWVPKVYDLSRKAKEVYVMFNNCFAYYALKNAKMFGELVGGLRGKKSIEVLEIIPY